MFLYLFFKSRALQCFLSLPLGILVAKYLGLLLDDAV
jgi:hypothetical protein